MPTLRSQYQHVKSEYSKTELGISNLSISPNIMPTQQMSSSGITSNASISQSSDKNELVNGPSSQTGQAGQVWVVNNDSPSKNIINVSSSDDDKSLSSSNSSSHRQGKKGVSRNRKSSRNSSSSKKSSRLSSGSVGEDLLNTATVHSTVTSKSDPPLYTSTSLPTLLTPSNNLQYNAAAFAAYKLTAETAIMQSLHVPTRMDRYAAGVHNLGTLPYIDQQAYIPLLMENREAYNVDYHSAHSSQSSLRNDSMPEDYLHLNSNECLRRVLDKNGCFETMEGMAERAKIVKSLDILVKQWIRSCGLEKGLVYTVVESNQGMVLTYGSCKLEAADKDADMDLICIAPSYVTREDFFTKMYHKLHKHESVHELRQLPDVFVPVMKFKFNETEVDFTFCRLNKSVPEKEEHLLEEIYTKNLDDRCLRSLNGYRATCQILTLVPDIKVFQLSLRAIKLWGKLNGIYGNILGYLGGASWAILVARTCQEQAKRNDVEHCPREVIFTFFHMYSQWKWPAPLYIRQVIDQPSSAWNPSINPADRDHCMPIITSSIPQMNSAVNINKSIQLCIQERMLDAHHTCLQIQSGSVGWEALFKSFPFYQEYEDFIRICGECETDFYFWFGCLESKLRHLREKIDSHNKVHSVRIWPKGFIRKEKKTSTVTWFIGIDGNGCLEKYIEEDLLLFRDKCYGDLRRRFGSSPLVQRAFSINHKLVHRNEILKFLSFQELKMTPVERTLSYASVTQGGGNGRSATPPVISGAHSQMNNLSQGVVYPTTQPLNTYTSMYSSQSVSTSFPKTCTTTSTIASTGAMNPNYAGQHIIPLHNIVPYYHHLGLYQQPHERLSPPAIMIPKGRSSSPRLGTSPCGYASRNHSPNLTQRQTNSPNQFIYSDGISTVANPYLTSPKPPYYRTYSPKPGPDRSFPLGPFPFPPPIRPVATTPPAAVQMPSTMSNTPPPSNNVVPTVTVTTSSMNTHKRSDILTTVVTGVTSINNNVKGKVPCSCESISDLDHDKASKENGSEDERLRSVSNSSDTVPPSFLYRARVNHQDAPPPSPFLAAPTPTPPSLTGGTSASFKAPPPVPVSPTTSSQSLPGMVPLSEADVTIPPPVPVSSPESPSDLDGPQFTFSNLAGGVKALKSRPHRSPRLSISELMDATSPRPVNYKNRFPIDIKVNICHNDEVFTK